MPLRLAYCNGSANSFKFEVVEVVYIYITLLNPKTNTKYARELKVKILKSNLFK